jgi:hypothetical protein
VKWGQGKIALWGTLVNVSRDEDTGEVDTCDDDRCQNFGGPLWMIKFDNGRMKPCCCEASIVDATPPDVGAVDEPGTEL